MNKLGYIIDKRSLDNVIEDADNYTKLLFDLMLHFHMEAVSPMSTLSRDEALEKANKIAELGSKFEQFSSQKYFTVWQEKWLKEGRALSASINNNDD